MNMKRFFCTANLLLGLALALAPFVLAPVCEAAAPHGGHMKCWYSAVLITVVGAASAMLSLLCLVRGGKGAFFAVLFGAAAACVCWLVPEGVFSVGGAGWCADTAHACREGTRPLVLKLAGALGLTDLIGLVLLFVKGER